MEELAELEAADRIHISAVGHTEAMDGNSRPVVIEQHLRGHRLAMPWRRGLPHDEKAGLLRNLGFRGFSSHWVSKR
jgi:hypothetical protein